MRREKNIHRNNNGWKFPQFPENYKLRSSMLNKISGRRNMKETIPRYNRIELPKTSGKEYQRTREKWYSIYRRIKNDSRFQGTRKE